MKIYISTLGEFDIKLDDTSLLKDLGRTYRLYKLFQFFLTFRNKKLLPETILENLWGDSESSDPKNMLRTQIFRLRAFIKTLVVDEDERKYISVDFINGYYCLNLGENVTLDVDEFEQLINEGDLLKNENQDRAIQKYYEAINIYKGLYLEENHYEVWLVPTRNYYNRLYLKTLYKLMELLKFIERYEEIVLLCENALLLEPYEEGIHIQMMDTLLLMGYHKEALCHYENTISLLEKEMGVKPSEVFTSYLKKIQNVSSNSNNVIINIDDISKVLNDSNIDGAYCCSKEDFNLLINVQKRRTLRKNEFDYLGLITINENFFHNNFKLLEDYSIALNQVLAKSLKKGDVFSNWNDNQIVMLLHDVHDDGIIKIKNRLRKDLKSYDLINIDYLSLTFQSLEYEDIVI